MDLSRLTVQQRLSGGAMIVVVIAAFLPWVAILGISVSGLEGDGVLTLILGVVGLILLALSSGVFGEVKLPESGARIAQIVLAALVSLIALIDMNGAAAIGLYLTLLAGLAWLGGAIWDLASSKVAGPDASQ